MVFLLTLLIVAIVLGLALTIWIVWRSAVRQAEKEKRLTQKTRAAPSFSLAKPIRSLFRKSEIDEEVWQDIKDVLVLADMGVDLAEELIQRTKAQITPTTQPNQALEILSQEIGQILAGNNTLDTEGSPAIWLVVGVNGSGKTTSIAKLAHAEISAGKKVVLAAADTFRAAAIEQLQNWAERIGSGFVKGESKGDSAAVVFDAIQHAKARDADLVIVDTAGRLHTNANLMGELQKIKKTAEKSGGKVNETLLVIDATTGQNGLTQAREFTQSVGVSGVVLTKLDGSTKGGIVAGIVHELGIPIKRVGVGEQLSNIHPFNAKDFADSLIINV